MSASTQTEPDLVDYDEVLTRYEPLIGLETHVELGTASKMFCGCATTFGAEPNTQTCPVCLGLPGSLPVANEAAIESTVRIGLALGCRIASWSRFARKNYFYPDIPKGFQTTQYDEPLCTAGHLDVEVDGETYRVEIERVHLEEDTGKNLHVGGATGRIHGADHSLIDYNRAGIPLVEIVTRPISCAGAKAPEVARAYVAELRDMVQSLGVSDVKMEQGSLRSDVNVSLAPIGSLEWGTRTETKNVNSLRSVERAVRFEMRRQAAVLDRGGRIVQETRHFHEDTGTTSPGRSKEEATDYRYFPEPDLVPVAPDEEWVAKLAASLPELPAARRARLTEEWGLSPTEMAWLVNAGALGLVADTVAAGASPSDARKWWLGELARRANDAGVELAELAVTPRQVAELAALIGAGTINDQLARQALDGVLAGEGDPAAVVESRGLAVMGESDELGAAVDEAIAGAPDVVAKVQGGKVQALGALVGAVMKTTRGKADAATVRRLLEERLLGS
ncbi:MAG: glutamyl-tRNA(Gln) amidotransferase, subunit [Blastococcus sp.]|nr:glutamyl-tRNA(Gln) amidotransferase, subunit [Blastococcus sp.]